MDDAGRNAYCNGRLTNDYDIIMTAGHISHTLGLEKNSFSTCCCVPRQRSAPSSSLFFCPYCRTAVANVGFSSPTPPTLLPSEHQRAVRLQCLPRHSIVSISLFDVCNAFAPREKNITAEIIDDVNAKRRNNTIAIMQRPETNARKWRCFYCHFPSFLFTAFSADALPLIEAPAPERANRRCQLGVGADKSGKRKQNRNHQAALSASSPTLIYNKPKMASGSRQCASAGSSAFSSSLLIRFLFCYLLTFYNVGCNSGSVDRSTAASSADGIAADYNDHANLETTRRHRYRKIYTNQWAVEIEDGSDETAEEIARRHGFTYLGHVIGNYYLFASDRTRRKRSTRRARYLQYELGREPQIVWLEQQVAKRRVKRDFLYANDPPIRSRRQVDNSQRISAPQRRDNPIFLQQQKQQQQLHVGRNHLEQAQQSNQPCSQSQGLSCPDSAMMASAAASSLPYGDSNIDRSRQYLDDFRHRLAFSGANGAWNVLGGNGALTGGSGYKAPNDPEWSEMWYLNRGSGLDHNVREAWQLGVTGRDVVVTILDDGLERNHPDLIANYDPQASYDINDSDFDPMPRYDLANENRHGTRCAGEVAAVFNNTLCIMGIAFGARIGGIRMLDGEVTDAVEAASLSHNRDHIDVYSASWGPDDDGKTVDGPARMAQQAFREGIESGRRGKGSIFVWASGNGGRDADSCNCDGYTNSIFTLSISSATENGNVPWYSEACSSTLASTYSSGSHSEKMIVTTDLHHGCTNSHTGTSASAPLAAGICALALEANPSLTWRDLQHIVVRTARPEHLKANDWIMNGVAKNVSHSFGFGLMDAGAMVRLAKNWTLAPPQRRCAVRYEGGVKQIPQRTTLQVTLTTDGCSDDDPDARVAYLEHVQSRITLSAQKRGDIQIFLTSPLGTKSTLLAKRARDAAKTGFRDWAFMTTHCWGEPALGSWKLEIQNDGFTDATLFKWELVMYGTSVYVGPYGGVDAGAGVTNNHVQRSEGSLWSAHGAGTASTGLLATNCCLTTPLGLCAACRSGLALFQNRCVHRCPSHYHMIKSVYRPLTNGSACFEFARCTMCHPSCVRCRGPADHDCDQCVVGYGKNNRLQCVRRYRYAHRTTARKTYNRRMTDQVRPNFGVYSKSHLQTVLVAGGISFVVLIIVASVTSVCLIKRLRDKFWTGNVAQRRRASGDGDLDMVPFGRTDQLAPTVCQSNL